MKNQYERLASHLLTPSGFKCSLQCSLPAEILCINIFYSLGSCGLRPVWATCVPHTRSPNFQYQLSTIRPVVTKALYLCLLALLVPALAAPGSKNAVLPLTGATLLKTILISRGTIHWTGDPLYLPGPCCYPTTLPRWVNGL